LRSSFWSKAHDCGSRRDDGQVHRLPRAFSPKGAGIMFSRSPGLSTSANCGSSRTDSGSRHASTRSPRSPTGRRRTLPRPQPSGLTHRYFQHALATSPSVSRLRALGVVDRNTKSVLISFGEGDDALRREVRVTHRQFPNGGCWSFFTCPQCERRARVLKVHDGAVMCWRCCAARGVRYRSASGSPVERDAARVARLERLREFLDGGPARLHPRRGRSLDRPRELTLSLRRALIRQRQDLLSRPLNELNLQ
jgi:hypothetical protein